MIGEVTAPRRRVAQDLASLQTERINRMRKLAPAGLWNQTHCMVIGFAAPIEDRLVRVKHDAPPTCMHGAKLSTRLGNGCCSNATSVHQMQAAGQAGEMRRETPLSTRGQVIRTRPDHRGLV